MESRDTRYGYRRDYEIFAKSRRYLEKEKYYYWRDAYHSYLLTFYDLFLKLYKNVRGRYIDFEEFSLFAYKTSSKYISPFL